MISLVLLHRALRLVPTSHPTVLKIQTLQLRVTWSCALSCARCRATCISNWHVMTSPLFLCLADRRILWQSTSRFGYLLKVDTSDHHDFLMVVSKIKMLEGNHPFPCDRY